MNKHVGKIVFGLMLSVSLLFSIAQAEEIKEQDDPDGKKLEVIKTQQQAALRGKIEIIEKFIAEGGDVNAFSLAPVQHGDTIIFSAIAGNQLDIVKLLVEKGADVNHEMPNGMRPLNLAVMMSARSGQLDVVDYLRENGAEMGDPEKKRQLISKPVPLDKEMLRKLDEPIGSSSNKSEDKKN